MSSVTREQMEDESHEAYILRRAREIHLEEAPLQDQFIIDKERVFLIAKHIGLISEPIKLDEQNAEA